MKRYGQAALEFLSTYGFAFLIILVMIGALAYFGVLNPSRFLPERCLLGQEFDCRDFQLDRDSSSLNVSLYVANNVGNTVILSSPNAGSASTTGASGYVNATCSPVMSTCPQSVSGDCGIPGGQEAEITCQISDTFPAEGEKLKVQLDLSYTELGGKYPHPIKGEIFATLQ